MGYLLKEALKTLCGVNQWSYAVFWKIGCQNPKLLIWEECYYEPVTGLCGNENPETAFQDYSASWFSAETRSLGSHGQAGDKVHLLVNKMMMDNQVNIVGEGLVGRVAFTGNHQWILSENYFKEAHPPEVLKEVCQQFSAGMQTVAVIPVLPHGVVQFGAFSTIRENAGFINDVISLVLQLGYVSGALLSGNDTAHNTKYDDFNYVAPTTMVDTQTSFSLAREIRNEIQSNGAAFQSSNSTPIRISPHQLMNRVAKAEVIPSNSDMWNMNQNASLYTSRSTLDLPSGISSNLNRGSINSTEPKILSETGNQGYFGNIKPISGLDSVSDTKWVAHGNITSKNPASRELKNGSFSKMEVYSSDSLAHFATSSLLAYGSSSKDQATDTKFGRSGSNASKGEREQNMVQARDIPLPQYAAVIPGFVEDERKENLGGRIPSVSNTRYEDSYVQTESGDDLFDVLGADFKSKLFNNCWTSSLSNWDKNNLLSSEIYSTSQGNSESGIFSSTNTDHLLEAVVSKANPSMNQCIIDDDVSCKTTLTNASSSSAPSTSLPYGRLGFSDHLKGELFGVPKYLAKAAKLMSSCSKEESGTYSQGSSIYGSQISSWVEKDHQKGKQSNSVSTGYSKKPEETGKTNRKRLKPGENPRPRPKDRQMIQDRVKELREIVPNGAKCSIDALLERTIKHMLFLQSVTKHADKLKQTGESKIISKDGGLLLKDNFEGGATWAYEVGSQSMVCPIIVEDLNQPRQMLVEMLCEERGLFLEIADIIRGLGLTILKGVMETRNDKIWARFAVEANRDVTRMEIFISLVRLLEQSSKTGVAQQPNGESLMMAHQQFHQLASLPGGSIS